LPGTVNPRVLENMFRQQSGPWKGIATIYIDKICTAVRNFNNAAFQDRISDEDLRRKLTAKLTRGHEMTCEIAKEQLLTILNDERGGILQTVNHYFADTLTAIRKERCLARLEAVGFEDGDSVDIAQMVEGVHLSNEDQAVNDIHDNLKAYYKVALKRFTDNIVLQITERLLLGAEGPVRILSPEMIGDLQDSELMDLAGENFATSSTRNELVWKYERFRKALDIAKQALMSYLYIGTIGSRRGVATIVLGWRRFNIVSMLLMTSNSLILSCLYFNTCDKVRRNQNSKRLLNRR
jgi:hypothetical protein